MSIRMFSRLLNPAQIQAMQLRQRPFKYLLTGTCDANAETLLKTTVTSDGHFLSLDMTGHYETLDAVTFGGATHTEDDGYNHLRARIQSSANQQLFFSDYIPVDLFLSPGRVKSAAAHNTLLADAGFAALADPSNPLWYPSEFEMLFTANSDIQCFVKNTSNVAMNLEIVFHGVWLSTAPMPSDQSSQHYAQQQAASAQNPYHHAHNVLHSVRRHL